MTLGGICLGFLAIFLPPLAVIIRRGCGAALLINILLCLLGWIPGVLHAWYIILEYPSARQRHYMRKARRRSAAREEGYVPRSAHSRRARSRSVGRHTASVSSRTRSRSVGEYTAPVSTRTRSRSVGRRSGETRRPYRQDHVYDDREYYAPAPRNKH